MYDSCLHPHPSTETWRPDSFYDRILSNRKMGLHTLCLLDIKVCAAHAEVGSICGWGREEGHSMVKGCSNKPCAMQLCMLQFKDMLLMLPQMG